MGEFMSGESGKEVPHIVRAVMQVLIMEAKKVMSQEDAQALHQLESHFNHMRSTGGKWAEMSILARGAWTFSGTQSTFDIDTAEEMFSRLLTNCLTLVTPTFDPLGLVLDPLAARANHSCDPNAVVVMDGPELSFRTLKPIGKDEEIFISYIDVTNPFARRQDELKERYFFNCKCSKCRLGPTQKEDKWALSPDKLPGAWAETADVIIASAPHIVKDPVSFVGDDKSSQRLTALQYTAFSELEHARRMSEPSAMVRILEGGMKTCFQSKMWPVYRQPYPALRDDLIVAYISSGESARFLSAFVHGVKRYFQIDPVLFPQPFHPVRVVHTYTLATLALWLSSAPEDCPMDAMKFLEHGIDLGVVIFGLLVEVHDNVQKSHGQNSSFAKIIQKKFEEMRTDITRGDAGMIAQVMGKIESQWSTLRAFGLELEV
ncbi:hypothetical protein NA57DRAFT_74883 [Rhizodiscina lignyota]|uniref:SET domain-containing protein n=1 Tax=Rhizodiscina lignyota TaxID=1504668 RepID=A0A9P4IGU2_9PEZI|nr:hypothetical protein NA57DRAFT_74883 [Rhizodiscina lignyota]